MVKYPFWPGTGVVSQVEEKWRAQHQHHHHLHQHRPYTQEQHRYHICWEHGEAKEKVVFPPSIPSLTSKSFISLTTLPSPSLLTPRRLGNSILGSPCTLRVAIGDPDPMVPLKLSLLKALALLKSWQVLQCSTTYLCFLCLPINSKLLIVIISLFSFLTSPGLLFQTMKKWVKVDSLI